MPSEDLTNIELFPAKKKHSPEQLFIALAYGCLVGAVLVMLVRAVTTDEINKRDRANERKIYRIAHAAASQQVQIFREGVTDAAEVAARRAIHEHMAPTQDINTH